MSQNTGSTHVNISHLYIYMVQSFFIIKDFISENYYFYFYLLFIFGCFIMHYHQSYMILIGKI